jgi:hypothetical protein
VAKKHSSAKGSKIAKSGFANEDKVSQFFNEWKTNQQTKTWLKDMEIDISNIKQIHSNTSRDLKLGNIKSDVIVTIDSKDNGISIKFYNANFNQLQRGSVDNISKLLKMPEFVTVAMKKFVGAEGYQLQDYMSKNEIKLLTEKRKKQFTPDQVKTIERHKKLLISEFDPNEKTKIQNWFDKNKEKIIRMLLQGNNPPFPKWFLAVQHKDGIISKTKIISMDAAVKHYALGGITFSKLGIFSIGKITMQRKSGDGGRITGQDLQFKIKPEDIFTI